MSDSSQLPVAPLLLSCYDVSLCYANDIIVVEPNPIVLFHIQEDLQKLFKLEVLDTLKYFLALEMTSYLYQRKYVSSVLVSWPQNQYPTDLRLKLLATEDKILLEYFLYRRL